MRNFITAFVFCFTALPLTAVAQGALIGHWPLQSDAEDITGQMPPMQLSNAPFENGGVFCNGLLSGSTASMVETPTLPISLFQGFTVSVQFMVDEIPVTNHAMSPVLVGGRDYRWIAFELMNNGTVGLLCNNFNRVSTTIAYTADEWHEAMLSYDSSMSMFKMYLNGSFVAAYPDVLEHGTSEGDRTFLIRNNSNASVFKGYLRDLKIWLSTPATSVPQTTALPDGEISLAQNFPNPAYEHTVLRFTLSKSAHAELEVHNTLGEKVATLHSGYFDAGEHTAAWSTAAHPPGVYFYRLRVGDRTVTKMMQVIR